MTEAIIVALITGGLSLLGVLITSSKTARDVQAKLDTHQAVTEAMHRIMGITNLPVASTAEPA